MTDGYIGNDRQILGEVHERISASRVFSFGVGQSPNRYLLDRVAKLGRGAVAYLGLNDNASDVMDDFFGRISHPALTDIEIDWGGMKVSDVYPQRIPDLFVGRPVILTGRFSGSTERIRVSGQAGGERREFEVAASGKAGATHAGLPSVWARMKIADLCDSATYIAGNELPQMIKEVALEYGLMSDYTAFVAVDSLTRTEGDYGTTVQVPVPVPEGVRYDTTVKE
jgi:Ca-activated chloride channel family protein